MARAATIFAQATGLGKAGVAIVRVSGPRAFDAAAKLCVVPEPRVPSVRLLRGRDGAVIDEALVLAFSQDASFTGEDVVEFHVHGSLAVVASVSQELSQVDFVRPAEPGEFTRRAFENGRLDLIQVEGLADLIEAETEAQRRLALDVFSGKLSERFQTIRDSLLRATALTEATVDFADEEVPEDVWPEVWDLLGHARAELTRELAGLDIAQRMQSGFEVAIVGAPNSGKSSLLNAISGRDSAIVTDIPGTTRDSIEVRIDLGGLPVTFIDTAGLRSTQDPVEQLGVERAYQRARGADLRIFLSDDDAFSGIELFAIGDLKKRSKADLEGRRADISAKTGAGIDLLLSEVQAELEKRASLAGLSTKERHRTALVECLAALEQACEMGSDASVLPEILSLNLRRAMLSLDHLVGRVGVEDVLGEIFSSFCIGK